MKAKQDERLQPGAKDQDSGVSLRQKYTGRDEEKSAPGKRGSDLKCWFFGRRSRKLKLLRLETTQAKASRHAQRGPARLRK